MKKSSVTASLLIASVLIGGCSKVATDNVSTVNVSAGNEISDGDAAQIENGLGSDLGNDSAAGNAL